MKGYDVVVVGGGPAGSTTARVIASRGHRVVILEKKEKIGVPVRCGEFVPEIDELRKMLPLAEDLEEVFDIPNALKSRMTNDIVLISPHGREFRFEFSGYSTWRDKFDLHLVNEARRHGAEICTGASVIGLIFSDNNAKGVRLAGNGEVIEGRIIVGADGPHSTVARAAGLPEQMLIPAVTCNIPGEFGSSVRMFFGSIAPGGYAWVIPKDRSANIGLGTMMKKVCGKNIKDLLREFLASQNLTLGSQEITGKFIPINGPRKITVLGNILLVGDSAGHVMATNGGGIPIAMICGYIAGNVISDYLEGKCEIREYEDQWRRQVGRQLETSRRMRALAARIAFTSDNRLETWMRILGARGLEKVIKCRTPFSRVS